MPSVRSFAISSIFATSAIHMTAPSGVVFLSVIAARGQKPRGHARPAAERPVDGPRHERYERYPPSEIGSSSTCLYHAMR